MALPGKEALDVILESPMPARLVQSLAEEDLFWLVQDIGPEDALQILARASNDQWQYLLDIELWHRDRLANDAVNRWMHLFMKADRQRFVAWGVHNNMELLELHLFRNLEVRIKDQEDDPSDFGEGFFSLDDIFFIRISDNKSYQTIRQFLELLAEQDVNRYREVLLEIGGMLPAETEEAMYRFRNMRLAEKGFLPFEEAVGIYQPASPEKLLKKDFGIHKEIKQANPLQVVPVSGSLFIKDHSLFSMALKHVEDDDALDQIQMEFAALCNQLLSADSIIAREKEDLAAIVRKACGYLDIALEEMVAGDSRKAVTLIEKSTLNDVFRVGYGTALALKWKADKWTRRSWFITQGFDFDFWEDLWEGLLEGLSGKRPLLYMGFSESGESFREFRSLEEIHQCHGALDQVMALDRLLYFVYQGATPMHLEGVGYTLTYKNLLLTSWARHHLDLREDNRPLTAQLLPAFFRDLWAEGSKPHRVAPAMKEGFMAWLTAKSGLAPHEIQGFAGKTFDFLFTELEKEYGAVSLKNLDPRYVRHFLVVP